MPPVTNVRVWADGNGRVPYPVEVLFGDGESLILLSVKQAKVLRRQLRETIAEVKAGRA